jgi:hypothetical protein
VRDIVRFNIAPAVVIGFSLFVAHVGPVPAAGAQSLPHRWSQYYGGVDHQIGRTIATDSEGNIYFAGEFMGVINVGDGWHYSADVYDIFLAKFDPDGNPVWSTSFPGANNQFVNRLDVQDNGDVVIVGQFAGSVDFGDTLLVSAGGYDAYAAKFSTDGVHIWSQRFGDAGRQECHGVAIGSGGATYLIGFFDGTIDLGGGPLTSAGGYDVWLAELSNGGTHVWSKRFGDASDQIGYGIDVSPGGGLAITGHAKGTINLGGGPLTSAGDYDMFVARFTTAGIHQWSHLYGDAAQQAGFAVKINDVTNELTALGQFQGMIDMGGGPLTSAGLSDVCLARLTPAGFHIWSRRFGGTQGDYPRGVALYPSGKLALTGFFEGTADFGGDQPLTSAGATDIFFATYDAMGIHCTSQCVGDSSSQIGQDVTVDPEGNVLGTGAFFGTVNFGGNPLVSTGNYDVYLVKFGGASAVPEAPGSDGPFSPPDLAGQARDTNPFGLRLTPNPAGPGSTLSYTLPAAAQVRMRVFDAEGRCLSTLTNEWQEAGAHAIAWKAAGAGAITREPSSNRMGFVQLEVDGRATALRAIDME